jgi:hypothetical protein
MNFLVLDLGDRGGRGGFVAGVERVWGFEWFMASERERDPDVQPLWGSPYSSSVLLAIQA